MPLFNNDKSKVLFIHIPKSGGTSIEIILSETYKMSLHSTGLSPSLRVTPQHLQISDIKIMLNQSYWNYSFAIVRNPYDRLESEYFYRVQKNFPEHDRRPDFSNWIINHIDKVKKNKFHLDNHLRPQYQFVDSDVEIFKFEDGFDFIVNELSDKLGFEKPDKIVKTNTSDRTEINWSLDARILVNNFYNEDFKLFNYNKIEPTVNILGK